MPFRSFSCGGFHCTLMAVELTVSTRTSCGSPGTVAKFQIVRLADVCCVVGLMPGLQVRRCVACSITCADSSKFRMSFGVFHLCTQHARRSVSDVIRRFRLLCVQLKLHILTDWTRRHTHTHTQRGQGVLSDTPQINLPYIQPRVHTQNIYTQSISNITISATNEVRIDLVSLVNSFR